LLQDESVAKGEQGTPQVKLGIDVESKRLTSSGTALFNEDGSSTDYLKSVSEVLGAFVTGTQLTQAFLQALSERGLISPAKLSVQSPDNKEVSFGGLYTVDEDKLRSLPDSDVLGFHQMGYIQACYAMIHSLGHMEKLFEWKNQSL
jgi:hypothetical protein